MSTVKELIGRRRLEAAPAFSAFVAVNMKKDFCWLSIGCSRHERFSPWLVLAAMLGFPSREAIVRNQLKRETIHFFMLQAFMLIASNTS
jgi:hypothetical protein